MLLRLRHEGCVRSDDEQRDVDPGGAGEHVADEAFVPRDVHDARLQSVAQRQWGESQIDRNATALLFFPAIGVDAGERLDQGGLAVVDVAGRADYEAAGAAHAWRSQNSTAGRRSGPPILCPAKRTTKRRGAAACGGSSARRAAAPSFNARRAREASAWR